MKRIIDGKAYNTETATKLGAVKLRGMKYSPDGMPTITTNGWNEECGCTTLYQTAAGAYFIVREISEGCYAAPDKCGTSRTYINAPGIHILSREEATAWAEYHKFETEKIEEMFGKLPEAGTKNGSILLRVPEVLKHRMEEAAHQSDSSVNSWAMRCLETCAALEEIKGCMARIAWIARTHASRPDERAFSRKAMGEMLDEIDSQAEQIGLLLGVDDWFGGYGGTHVVEDIPTRYKPYDEQGNEFQD